MKSLNPISVIWTLVLYTMGGLILGGVAAVFFGYGAMLAFVKWESLGGPAFGVGAATGALFGIWAAGKGFFERLDDMRSGMS